MIKQLLYKWFGLVDVPCNTCEILRLQLDESNRERKDLLNRLLDKDKPEPLAEPKEIFQPITSRHIPWSVRQQMLEAEDRKAAQLMREKQKELNSAPITKQVADLEKELGITDV